MGFVPSSASPLSYGIVAGCSAPEYSALEWHPTVQDDNSAINSTRYSLKISEEVHLARSCRKANKIRLW